MTKFCKDCKYYNISMLGPEYATCTSPAIPVNLVSGKKKQAFASLERRFSNEGDCGKGAKYFEQKVTVWQHVKQLMKIN